MPIGDRRSFTVEHATHGGKGGRYLSTSPYAAAKKAALILFRNGQVERLTLTLREATIGADHKKLFKYHAQLHRLAKPIILKIGNKIVKKQREVRIEAAK
jgi:hypothetical protein